MNATVEILLSTYNGEKYLNTQLESILQQDYQNWRLLVRDDGSKDRTLAVLNNYIQKYPDKIILYTDNEGNLGYSDSFTKLLRQSSANYLMFCDQDDYWYPAKISTMLSLIINEEANLPSTPHIVFSDLQVVNSELSTTFPSYFKLMNYSPKKGMESFFLKCYVPGCNLLFNRTLIQQAFKTDNVINLHDHWLLMVTSSVGKITSINKSLMKYRMHNTNAIGFSEETQSFIQRIFLFIKEILKYGINNKEYRNLLYSKNIQQMQNICKCLSANVSKEAIAFSNINSSNYFLRKMKNITNPYILQRSLLKRLTYIICF